MSAYDDLEQNPEVIEKPRAQQRPEDILPNTMVRAPAQATQAAEYSALMELGGREPRDREEMVREARRIGQLLGKKGFYRFPAGKGLIQGESIDLAYALAQAWGRCITRCVVTGGEGSRVTMRGIFVDMLTLAICERDYVGALAPAPAKFADDPVQIERWRTMQEQAAISKAVRGAILGGLPTWYTEAGLQAAIAAADSEVLRGPPDKHGKPTVLSLAEARTYALTFWGKIAITQAELETYLGMPAEMWSVVELQRLYETYGAIKRGTSSVERIKAEIAEIGGQAAKPAAEDGKDATGVRRTRKASGTGAATASEASKSASEEKPAQPTPDELRGAEADAGEGAVKAAREKLGIAMSVPAHAIAGQSNAREYLVLLQGGAK